jgi:hypothetical protein
LCKGLPGEPNEPTGLKIFFDGPSCFEFSGHLNFDLYMFDGNVSVFP